MVVSSEIPLMSLRSSGNSAQQLISISPSLEDKSARTVVDHGGQVTSIVEDHVGLAAVGEGSQALLNAPEVLLLGLSLPGKDGDAAILQNQAGSCLFAEQTHVAAILAYTGQLDSQTTEKQCSRSSGMVLGREDVAA